jgi:hypothetical protein
MPTDQDISPATVSFAAFAGQYLVADNSNEAGQLPAGRDATRSSGQRLFGQKGTPASRPAFGRRVRKPEPNAASRKDWLRTLHAELRTVFSDPLFPESGVPIRFIDANRPLIQLGQDVTIRLDDARGVYVLQRTGGTQDAETITTPDDEQVLDFVAAHLARTEQPPLSGLAHIEASVGRTIEDVERALILATLRHCRGNRTRAAGMLGITRRTLRSKLQSYWESLLAQERQKADRHAERGDGPTTR